MSLEIVILAAGAGTRMKSQLPKVLHPLAGKSMLLHIIETACSLQPQKLHLVLGHQASTVMTYLQTLDEDLQAKFTISIQEQQLGTGHALMQVQERLADDAQVLVLYGDTPLVKAQDLQNLVQENCDLAILTAICDDPFGYGRIIRNERHDVVGIVEQKDCSDKEALIKEINTGMICTKASLIKQYLTQLKNNNAQHEYYLTDLAGLMAHDKLVVKGISSTSFKHTLGINNKVQLSMMERIYQEDKAHDLMMQGVTFADPKRFDLRGELEVGQDVFIDINVIIEGKVKLGNNVTIGAGSVIKDSVIADNSIISPYCVIEQSQLDVNNTIGPFARLRPGNVFAPDVHVGNFVEVKKSNLALGVKAGHLSYLGDSDIGARTNIGAGTITCNYDGANKHKTIIGDDVFVGSDTQLVAPVTVKDKVTLGAGTTMTKSDCHQEGDLIVTRARARIISGYQRPSKVK